MSLLHPFRSINNTVDQVVDALGTTNRFTLHIAFLYMKMMLQVVGLVLFPFVLLFVVLSTVGTAMKVITAFRK